MKFAAAVLVDKTFPKHDFINIETKGNNSVYKMFKDGVQIVEFSVAAGASIPRKIGVELLFLEASSLEHAHEIVRNWPGDWNLIQAEIREIPP